MPASSDRSAADDTPRRLDPRALPHLATGADAEPDSMPSDVQRRRRALDLVADALAAVPLSLEAVRAAAVRYGLAARDAGQAPAEMAAALAGQVRRAAARRAAHARAAAELARLEASVAWWGAHGYHRAD